MTDREISVQTGETVEKAKFAAAVFLQYSQEQIDAAVKAAYEAAFNARVRLAKMAVEETGIGKWQDKTLKNVVATQLVYEDIKDETTVGILGTDPVTGITSIAQPMGPIFAVIPVTNPTSTVFFKILICLKTRNPVIISPSRKAKNSSSEAARLMYEAALGAGAPEDCVQWLETSSREQTKEFMTHPDIALILATGGTGLVQSAYSSGTPALGVGAGNVPVFIDKSADIDFAVKQIILSKTFDYGTVCASEQAVVTEKKIAKDVLDAFIGQKAYVLDKNETEKLSAAAFDVERGGMNPDIVGKSACAAASLAGISVPEDTSVLIARLEGIGSGYPLSSEILAPILAFYSADSFDGAIKTCIELNYRGGIGHSASIFANDDEVITKFSMLMNAGRIVVNTPSSHGAVGGIYNMLRPSMTLGCGTGGKNITTDNVTASHLLNIQRIARRRESRFTEFDVSMYLDESKTHDEIMRQYLKNR